MNIINIDNEIMFGGLLDTFYEVHFLFFKKSTPPWFEEYYALERFLINDVKNCLEVINWAEKKAAGEPFQIFVRSNRFNEALEEQENLYKEKRNQEAAAISLPDRIKIYGYIDPTIPTRSGEPTTITAVHINEK